MKTKNYLIAIAIFGGILFTAQAVNASPNGAKIEKAKIKVPPAG
ncbi:hypothetical protein [Confluentibacter sediminis]|nr:hypothetical protein [Confluentibacter sediminis]